MIRRIQKELENYGFETQNTEMSTWVFTSASCRGFGEITFRVRPPDGYRIFIEAWLRGPLEGLLRSEMIVSSAEDVEALAPAIYERALHAVKCYVAFVETFPKQMKTKTSEIEK